MIYYKYADNKLTDPFNCQTLRPAIDGHAIPNNSADFKLFCRYCIEAMVERFSPPIATAVPMRLTIDD
ncbi:MAG: hypothetical protein ACR2PG_11070 [Hyphomicrobiaceae bacterium]